MKLNELAVTRPTQQIAKVFEGHFDQRVQIDSLNRNQLHNMYRQVRGVLSEVRSSPARHRSEQDPAYLKLMIERRKCAHTRRSRCSRSSHADASECGDRSLDPNLDLRSFHSEVLVEKDAIFLRRVQ